MFQRIFIFMLIFSICLSCKTNQIIYNETIPVEETAIIRLGSEIKIVSFNGDDVNWVSGFWKSPHFIIPSGKSNSVLSISADRGGYRYSGGRFNLTYTFEKSNKYLIYLKEIKNLWEISIQINNETKKTKEIIVLRL